MANQAAISIDISEAYTYFLASGEFDLSALTLGAEMCLMMLYKKIIL